MGGTILSHDSLHHISALFPVTVRCPHQTSSQGLDGDLSVNRKSDPSIGTGVAPPRGDV